MILSIFTKCKWGGGIRAANDGGVLKDFATSPNPAVQTQLDRLAQLTVPQGRLGLDTIRALLARLGDPHLRLPPVFHVAGTNGKGSTCAFLRAMLEAEGYHVHATTSPHLVRYNERFRVAGELITDERLADLLAEVLDAGEDLNPSFFEVTIAAAFTEFARVPADACVVEVGLGGRFDATNVIENPTACGIAALGIDHEQFLLIPEAGTPAEPLARIAFEKAGIAKPVAPLVTLEYPAPVAHEITAAAERAGAELKMHERDWSVIDCEAFLFYGDRTQRGGVDIMHLPFPGIPGRHQQQNAGLAIAMLRHQDRISVSSEAIAIGLQHARWPGRLQRLGPGPLTECLPECGWLLDGGHNPQAAQALADYLQRYAEAPRHAIIGMLANKDWRGFLDRLAPLFDTLVAVPVPGHECAPPGELAAYAKSRGTAETADAENTEEAIEWTAYRARDGTIFLGGSLYLAGEILRLNGEIPN